MSRGLLPILAVAAALGCSSAPIAPRPVPRAMVDAHAREIHALAFSPGGAMFASAGGGAADPAVDEITLWTTATGARRMTFATYKGVAASLAFSPDGTLLAVGGTDGRIALLEIDSGTERASFTHPRGRVDRLAFSYDGKALVSVVHFEGDAEEVQVCRWDVTRGVPRDSFAVAAAAAPIALSPDGASLAWPVRGEEAGIRILDLETKSERVLSNIGVTPGDTLIYSPDGRWLAAVHHRRWSPLPNHCPYVYLIDSQTGRIRLRSPRPFDARRGLALSHDARLLARGVDSGLQIWDLQALEVRATVHEPESATRGAEMLVFSPDDRTLVSTDGGGVLLVWDVSVLVDPRRSEPRRE
jgi:WD40 repeat protein